MSNNDYYDLNDVTCTIIHPYIQPSAIMHG